MQLSSNLAPETPETPLTLNLVNAESIGNTRDETSFTSTTAVHIFTFLTLNEYNISSILLSLVGPLTVEILGARDPLSSGREHLLSCVSSGSRPPARVSWWSEGRRLKHSTQKVATKS